MRGTSILTRSQNGWLWVNGDDDPNRIEMCQGQPGDTDEVVQRATAEIGTYGQGQVQITVGMNPAAGDPIAGVDWKVGDKVYVDGALRVVTALTLTVDDATGRVTPVPQFGTIMDSPSERIDRTIRSIGALSAGTSKIARPVQSLPDPNLRSF